MGDAAKETSPDPWDHRVPGLWLLDYTKQHGHVELQHSRTLIPKDPERYHLSTCLAFLMLRFIWLHELSHCFNGHVAMVQDKAIALRLYEVTPMQALAQKVQQRPAFSDEDCRNILRHIEHDADQSAFWGGVNIQLGKLENIQALIDLPDEQRLKLNLFANYVMPWLFEQYENYSGIAQRTHPEPIERLEYVFETSRDRFLSQHPELTNLNKAVLNQFDIIRQKIPALYQTEALLDLFTHASLENRHTNFDAEHSDLLQTLQSFQFTTKGK